MCCLRGIVILVVLLGALYGARDYFVHQCLDRFLDVDNQRARAGIEAGLDMLNMTYNIWWPGCGQITDESDVTQACSSPCYSPQLLKDMQEFNANHSGTLVSYSSRHIAGHQQIMLTGWWLPAPNDTATHAAPRIVLQHGFGSNSNGFQVQLAAYQLRTLGFSVLLNNFRDHGHSGSSVARINEWGHSYPYDLLGAWDYAVKDPNGKLGGAVHPSRVGLQGFSMGAFITLNAFGMEDDVPAAWSDSAPHTPSSVFSAGAQRILADLGISYLEVLVGSVWSEIEKAAMRKGVDLSKHTPGDELPLGPDTRRPVFLVGNRFDAIVPIHELSVLEAIVRDYPDKYDVKGVWVNEDRCGPWNHCVDHLRLPSEYKANLCRFWSSAFGISRGCPT